jgi:hypothetical protein
VYEKYFPTEMIAEAKTGGVSAEATYPSPAEFLQQTFPSGEISKSLNDPTLNAAKELPTFSKNVFGKNGLQNAFAEAGIIIEGGLGGPDTNLGFGIKLPSGSEKGFVIYGKPEEGTTKGIVINWRTEKTLDESIQQLQKLGPATAKEETEIIIHAFVQKLQSLTEMKSTLENQQAMNQELSLPGFSNLRA